MVPYNPDSPHRLYSLSKSFTSTAVGLAVEEGLMSLDDLVLDHFPEEAPAEPDENLAAMRVRDLLRMNTGHLKEQADAFWSTERDTWAESFLAVPGGPQARDPLRLQYGSHLHGRFDGSAADGRGP